MKRKRRRIQCASLFFLLGFCLIFCSQLAAQGPANDPAAALRDALAAACSQDAPQFAKSLTGRNAEAFAQLTPAARTTLLKRFVLLDEPGKPSLSNAPGGQTVTCATSQVTTSMEVGKPDLRDNLAFLPLTVRDQTDTAGENARHVTMGMVRENGQWKILSLGLLFLDLPALSVEWDRAEMKSNEDAAIVSLQTLADAIESYRTKYTHLPDSLAMLGPAPAAAKTAAAKGEYAGLVTQELAAGRKDGYQFRYVIVGANATGAPAKYELAAIPVEYGRTGQRSFFYDSAGNVHAGDHRGSVGDAQDPKLGETPAPPQAAEPPH